jgi:hypothetical protein
MLKRPKAQKHPADLIGMRIATGGEPRDFPLDDGKNKAAQSLGQLGGRARAKALSARRRWQLSLVPIRSAGNLWWSGAMASPPVSKERRGTREGPHHNGVPSAGDDTLVAALGLAR